MNAAGSRTLLALTLQCAALFALALALLGSSWLDPRSRPRLLVLLDRSQSVPRDAGDRAIAEIAQAATAAGAGELQLIEFAGRPSTPSALPLLSAPPAGAEARLDASSTDIEAALDAALVAHVRTPFDGLVMVSDGLANAGDTSRGLARLRQAGLSLQWLAVGRAPPPTRIADVLAPHRALVGQPLHLTVQLAGQLDRPLRVKATARTAGGEARWATAQPDGGGRAAIELDGGHGGPVLVDLALEDAASGATIDAMPDAAVVDVAPRAAMLYVQGGAAPLARSLRMGGWAFDVVAAARLDAQTEGLDGYQAVVLDDVAIADAGSRFWGTLVAAVKNRGLGLMVLGGERSFARGGYRGSVLESVLPVLSEPPALDQPAALMFAVDKSGSMGQGSAGVDRFQLAQRAVLETARGLTARDQLGLLVFDVTPRVLIPLGSAAAGTAVLERPWPASPNGGTRIAPALQAAVAELERSTAARRILVLVTDGFIDDAPLAELRARLARSRIETIALAVGPDADASALERVVGAEAGAVLRVNEAAELPAVMRVGIERARARVERGPIAVQQRQALPFSPGILADWPAVAAHFATRPRAEATVAVQTARGEALIAFQNVGRGRVVAVTSGLGTWTPQWLQWSGWPHLAGGLADWIGGSSSGAATSVAVSRTSGTLQVDVDVGPIGAPGAAASIAIDTPTTPALPLTADTVAPGRLRASLADAGPGLYTVLVSTPLGTQRHLHLLRNRAENEAWGINPALAQWKAQGLVADGVPGMPPARPGGAATDHPTDRSLIALALFLFMAGVLADRTRPDLAALRAAMRRWRGGLMAPPQAR